MKVLRLSSESSQGTSSEPLRCDVKEQHLQGTSSETCGVTLRTTPLKALLLLRHESLEHFLNHCGVTLSTTLPKALVLLRHESLEVVKRTSQGTLLNHCGVTLRTTPLKALLLNHCGVTLRTTPLKALFLLRHESLEHVSNCLLYTCEGI